MAATVMNKFRAFQSLVTLDLETTGLPHLENNFTKITEISLVACIVSCSQNGKLPRIINKLTLGVNPMKRISWEASKITGIENEFLEELATFNDDLVVILNNFLKRLPEPVCLIAHNGNRFDFPIFRKHLLACQTRLIDNIYCGDSYPAFKVILPISKRMARNGLEKAQMDGTITPVIDLQPQNSNLINRISINENTPKIKSEPRNTHPTKRVMDYHNKNQFSVARSLKFDEVVETETQNDVKMGSLNNYKESNVHCFEQSQNSNKNLKSYKLVDIYNFLHDDDKTFHRAEEDCLALLSCILKCKEEFLDWLQINACLLSDIKPLS